MTTEAQSTLRTTSLIAVTVGAIVSIGLMLRAGHPPLFLRVLFGIWVLSPFVILLLADRASKRWPVVIRRTLYVVMLVVTLGSLAVYRAGAGWARKSQPAFVFVMVPPVAWLLIAAGFGVPALVFLRGAFGVGLLFFF